MEENTRLQHISERSFLPNEYLAVASQYIASPPQPVHGTMQTAGLTGSAKLAYGKRPRPTAGLRNVRMRDRRLAFAEGD
jgi:hypothetical protein